MKFERLHQPLAPRRVFYARMMRSLCLAFALIGASLIVGMSGYHHLEKMSWLDAYANASMILSGMGPLAAMTTPAGKLFAGSYALYSGLFLIALASVVLGPVLHRFLHQLHIAEEDEQEPADEAEKPKAKVRRS